MARFTFTGTPAIRLAKMIFTGALLILSIILYVKISMMMKSCSCSCTCTAPSVASVATENLQKKEFESPSSLSMASYRPVPSEFLSMEPPFLPNVQKCYPPFLPSPSTTSMADYCPVRNVLLFLSKLWYKRCLEVTSPDTNWNPQKSG